MDLESLEKRPGIVIVGSPNVGKRTLLSRLLGVDFEDASDTSSQLSVHGWTINTKYYTADVTVWMAHLCDEFSFSSIPIVDKGVALVMVFDVSDITSLVALKDLVSHIDILKFDILLCIGNKVDLISGHPAHVEYKRRLQKKHGESSFNHHMDFSEYGISETEGSNLLGDEVPLEDIKTSCLEWCLENNIEYVEACASNADFDKCLSVDGDSQGVERLYGALSAHMWPGMLLKSGDIINQPSLPEEELSEEESDYEPEYEILSSGSGSAESWGDVGWMSANGPSVLTISEPEIDSLNRESEKLVEVEFSLPSTSASELHNEEEEAVTFDDADRTLEPDEGNKAYDFEDLETLSTSASELHNEEEEAVTFDDADRTLEPDEGNKAYDFEDLETLMSEIGNIRNGLRLMPDFQRREMAAKLAMKMAAMFGDSSGGEEEFD